MSNLCHSIPWQSMGSKCHDSMILENSKSYIYYAVLIGCDDSKMPNWQLFASRLSRN